jgi:proteasome assembly chaperone (PAC2) family protein
MVAVWPGMGAVAINAGYYLLAKLTMHALAKYEARELFDVDLVEVKAGIIQAGHHPRNQFFVWTDPNRKHDLVVFIGESQPPIGKYRFCHQLLEYARELGVERIFTFAAMATAMRPEHRARVFGAATDGEGLQELRQLDLEILEDGHIGGLNGVLLGAAAESGLPGACLLGEMPHLFAQLPFPKASLAILEVFTTLTGIELDFTELADRARSMEKQLGEVLLQIEKAHGGQPASEEGEYTPESPEDKRLGLADQQRIERLFEQAQNDRSKAFQLKQELDRLGAFKDYEDRFLDLFKKPG